MANVDWTTGHAPRFHPLATSHNGVAGWYIADSLETGRDDHSPVKPYIDAPCESREEAEKLAIVLNETEPDPRMKDEDDVFTSG